MKKNVNCLLVSSVEQLQNNFEIFYFCYYTWPGPGLYAQLNSQEIISIPTHSITIIVIMIIMRIINSFQPVHQVWCKWSWLGNWEKPDSCDQCTNESVRKQMKSEWNGNYDNQGESGPVFQCEKYQQQQSTVKDTNGYDTIDASWDIR